VLGRGVEFEMLHELARQAKRHHLSRIRILYEETPRNLPVRAFLNRIARPGSAGCYELTVQAAAEAQLDPAGAAPAAAPPARRAMASEPEAAVDYDTIAKNYFQIEAVVDSVFPPQPEMAGGGDEAEAGTEAKVARIWRALLQRQEIDPEAEFFALGGDSLLMVEGVSRLAREFGVTVPMTVFFETPTVRGLSTWLSQALEETEAGAEAELLDLVEQCSEEELEEYLKELEQRS
jgi:acyl carrier protein